MPEIILILHFSNFSDALFAKDDFLFHNKTVSQLTIYPEVLHNK